MNKKAYSIVLSLLLLGFISIPSSAQQNTQTIVLQQGDKIRVECTGNNLIVTSNGDWVEADCPMVEQVTPTTTEQSPTSTIQPTLQLSPTVTSTLTLVPTSTITPSPSNTASATNTPTQTHSNESMSLWHSPGSHDGLNTHEHGDKPPLWADQWSQQNFGHPVIFGGDETSSEMENTHKHQAFKGFLTNINGVDLYLRYHAASNPADRSSAFHSYEMYAKDSSGNVSFWQGLYWTGYPEFKSQRMTRRHEQPIDGFPGRDQFIIGSPDEIDWKNFLRCEQWYTFGGRYGWEISITICGSTTYFTYNEHLNDPMSISTWKPTGSLGLSRRLELTHYGVSNPAIKGATVPLNQWFCMSKFPKEDKVEGLTHRPTWSITGAVTSPNACPAGYLPQWKSSTFPSDGIYFNSPTGNAREKNFPGNGIVTIPN